MLNDWFQSLRFKTDWETFQKLPRHAAYRFEYLDGHCLISGRPVFYHAKLELKSFLAANRPGEESQLLCSTLQSTDWEKLLGLFETAFARSPPFAHLPERERLAAANSLIDRTRQDQDGVLQRNASCLVHSSSNGQLLGAALVTLIPDADLRDFTQEQWGAMAPPDAVETGWGQPHLTWIFVHPSAARKGIGARLLHQAAKELADQGYTHLMSTFLLGNEPSLLWHWRMGFQLLPHVGSW